MFESENVEYMWLNYLFWGLRNTFCGKISLFGDKWPSVHVDKSFKKIQAGVRPSLPLIQAMPAFWEHLVLQSLPKGPKKAQMVLNR